MAANAHRLMSEAEYLETERASAFKREYYHGEVFVMAGTTFKHAQIVSNTLYSLSAQFLQKGLPCQAVSSEVRLKIAHARYYTYPDVIVVCGDPVFTDDAFDTLLNPTVLIEVLSPSTEAADRGKKKADFMTIDTLQEYILIAQDQWRIEQYVRQADAWRFQFAVGEQGQLTLPSLGCTLALADVYAKVTFPDAPADSTE